MSTHGNLRLLAGFVLAIQTVAALNVTDTSGEEFSNNLFSDLAPLLALFGEQVWHLQPSGWLSHS
jgi:hypothetical protein